MRVILSIIVLFSFLFSANNIKNNSSVLTIQEQEYLAKKLNIKMCVDPNWMPFEKIENGKHIGLASDFLQLISQKIDTPIKLVQTKSWNESIIKAKNRECDILSITPITKDRLKYMNFTKPYITSQIVIATKNSEIYIDDISLYLDKKFAVVKGYSQIETLKIKYPTIKIVEVDSVNDGLTRVERKEIFAYIDNNIVIMDEIQKYFLGSIAITGKIEKVISYRVATRNDEPLLNKIFNKAISDIGTQQRQEIINRWVNIKPQEVIDYTLFYQIAFVVLIFIIFILFKNSRLRKEIEKREKIRKELEKQTLIASNATKAKSEFLANMSHEIRTPLNAILGFVDMIKEETKENKTLEYINIIDESSKGLLNIIEDILDFSKIENGKLGIDKIDFNSKAEFEVITHLFGAKCSQKNISLTSNIDKNIPDILNSDPLRIKQVISNLISNAVKFTGDGKNIIININYKDNLLNISVKDEGIGINKDKLEYIFDAFSQEDNSTTRKYGGTGLGLTISSQLTKLLGGELKVKSEFGSGSEFYLSIPVTIGKELQIENSNKLEFDFANKKILLVEDNKANQMFMKVVLKKMRLEFDVANDGLEAIEKYKANNYDIILMDENMPNMNGIEATRLILKYEKENNFRHTPIIALTANALKGDRERFLTAGMDEYLTKPLNKKKLSEILGRFL